MKINEVILEAHPFKHERTETIMVGGVKCIIAGHVWDQIENRPSRSHITDQMIWKIIKRVPYIKPKLDQMEFHDQFYLRDTDTGIELGCKFKNFGQPTVRVLYVNTVIFKKNLRNSYTPTIIVNPQLKEGGWDTTVTQGTVINPQVVKAALVQTQRFVNDFNKYLADRQRPPVQMGKPTGSSAYHNIDPDEKVYGDVDLQMIAPAEEGLTYGQFTSFYNKMADDFVKELKPAYVHPGESKPGHPIIQIGQNAYVQVDFMWHPENLAAWGAARVTPEHNVKGLLFGNMFSVLGELLDMSIQHAGVQLKVQDGKHVPFSKQRDVEVKTITIDPQNFMLDILKHEYEEITQRPANTQMYIDPMLAKNPGNDINDVKISKLVAGVVGLARSFQKNNMYGQGDLAKFVNAKDFISKFVARYEEKAMLDVNAKKRDKATTPEAIARAQADREKVLKGLETVKGYFGV